jgi:hypothetical protein
MTSFTFSAEQVRTAPPEVRRWMESEVLRALRGPLDQDQSKERANELKPVSFEEVVRIFNLIANNFIVVQVFFELGRETPFVHDIPQLHALDFADIVRHTQLADTNHVIECLNLINQALQNVRNDPQASVFAADEHGHVFVHDATSQNIRKLWEHLVTTHSAERQGLATEPGNVPFTEGLRGSHEQSQGVQPEHAFARTKGA